MRTIAYRGATLRNRLGRRATWFVTHRGRVRWGTLAEVRRDIDHLLRYHKFPVMAQSAVSRDSASAS